MNDEKQIKLKAEILIVDDNSTNLRLLSNMLGTAGYTVRVAINGPIALSSAKIDPPDLILLDVVMPGMNGYEVCTQLKEDERTRQIPILFVTGKNEPSDVVKGFNVGAVDYISKPITEEVFARVKTHLAIRSLHKQLEAQNIHLQKEIAKRKKAEKVIKLGRERLKMLNKIIRHDLSNDFTVIKSAVKIFARTSNKKMLNEIENRTEKSLQTITDYKKYEQFIDTNIDLVEIELTDLFSKLIVEFPKINFNIEGECKVLADDALKSVFINLISNSIIHGKSSQIDINISSDNNNCTLKFGDNGNGIPDEIKQKIFQEGFHYGKYGHTGIGLHIVKKTIDYYGGSISVKNNAPRGAVFVIILKKVLNETIT